MHCVGFVATTDLGLNALRVVPSFTFEGNHRLPFFNEWAADKELSIECSRMVVICCLLEFLLMVTSIDAKSNLRVGDISNATLTTTA
jgi:hypothetical protein